MAIPFENAPICPSDKSVEVNVPVLRLGAIGNLYTQFWPDGVFGLADHGPIE